jgi:uncharacterized protein
MADMVRATFAAVELRVPDTAERVVEGIVVPWGETSFLTPDPKGERFMPGSLTRTVTDRPKVKLFINHRHDEAVGKAVAWRPDDERGLWGSFHVPVSEAGDRVLAAVRDELLDAFSVGFRPIRVRRAADGAREVLEAALHEVSIAPVGAYDGAKVLAMRVPMRAVVLPPMPTVNLDPILLNR